MNELQRRPIGITLAVVAGAVVVTANVTLMVTSLLGVGTYHLGGTPISAAEFRRVAFPVLVHVTATAGIAATGLYRGIPWSRYVAVALFVGVFLYCVRLGRSSSDVAPDAIRGMALSVLLGGLTTWYLFFRENVVDYFLERDAEDGAPSPS